LAIGIPVTRCITMPGDIASASSPGHANRTLHPVSNAWRLLKIRWESPCHPQQAYPNDQLSPRP
jgi:hypothetical protein